MKWLVALLLIGCGATPAYDPWEDGLTVDPHCTDVHPTIVENLEYAAEDYCADGIYCIDVVVSSDHPEVTCPERPAEKHEHQYGGASWGKIEFYTEADFDCSDGTGADAYHVAAHELGHVISKRIGEAWEGADEKGHTPSGDVMAWGNCNRVEHKLPRIAH